MKIPNPWKWLTRKGHNFTKRISKPMALGIGLIMGSLAVMLYFTAYGLHKDATIVFMLFSIICLQIFSKESS